MAAPLLLGTRSLRQALTFRCASEQEFRQVATGFSVRAMCSVRPQSAWRRTTGEQDFGDLAGEGNEMRQWKPTPLPISPHPVGCHWLRAAHLLNYPT